MTQSKNELESALKNRVLKRLRALGGHWFKTHGGPYGVAGVFDIIGCYKGRFVAIELKRPDVRSAKSRMTPSQWGFFNNIVHNDGIAIVSDDDDEIILTLEGEDQ